MSTNVSSETKVYTWVKSNNHTAIKSPKLQKRNLWTTVLFLYSCEKYLSDARNCSFLYLCMTHILRLLPCWGRLFTWVPHSSLLRFFSLYVIISACVVMLHMGCPIGAFFVQAHNWTAVIWLQASVKATNLLSLLTCCCCCWCVRTTLCVCVCCRMIYIWKSFDVIIHAESQGNWPSSVGLVALTVESTRMERARVHTYKHIQRGASLGECFQINGISVQFLSSCAIN